LFLLPLSVHNEVTIHADYEVLMIVDDYGAAIVQDPQGSFRPATQALSNQLIKYYYLITY